jgi:hypothetical protein
LKGIAARMSAPSLVEIRGLLPKKREPINLPASCRDSRLDLALRCVLPIPLFCCACAAQSITLGVTGGGRVTDDVSCCATPESRRYVLGPTVELGLPLNLSVEFDVLYNRQGYQIPFSNVGNSGLQTERENDWQFPILLKYNLAVPMARPFFEIGFAPRTISGTITNTGVSVNGTTGQQTPFTNTMATNWTSSVGVVAGGGVQLGFGRLRVSPELRYTYWPNTSINVTFSNGPSFQSNQQQFDVLVNIGWQMIGGRK